MSPTASAEIHDLAAYRVKRQSQRRGRAGERRRFLWSWPNGQILAVDFPFSAARPAAGVARSR